MAWVWVRGVGNPTGDWGSMVAWFHTEVTMPPRIAQAQVVVAVKVSKESKAQRWSAPHKRVEARRTPLAMLLSCGGYVE